MGKTHPEAKAEADAPVASSSRLVEMVSQAFVNKQFEHGQQLMDVIGQMAQPLARDTQAYTESSAIKLASGSSRPAVYCIAPYMPMGAFQYGELAASFGEERNVWVLSNPGFSAQRALPLTLKQLLDDYRHAISASSHDPKFILVGHSGGGILARHLAFHLEKQGIFPMALVLIDSYPVGSMVPEFRHALMHNLASLWSSMPPGDEQLIAAAWYQRLLTHQPLSAHATPTLLVRAEDALPGMQPITGKDWKVQWPEKVSTIDVPGDHFSMIHQRADNTVSQIQQWLWKL